jgi:hypothetical protein
MVGRQGGVTIETRAVRTCSYSSAVRVPSCCRRRVRSIAVTCATRAREGTRNPLCVLGFRETVCENRAAVNCEVSGMMTRVGQRCGPLSSCIKIAGRSPDCARPAPAGRSTQQTSPRFIRQGGNYFDGLRSRCLPRLHLLAQWPGHGKISFQGVADDLFFALVGGLGAGAESLLKVFGQFNRGWHMSFSRFYHRVEGRAASIEIGPSRGIRGAYRAIEGRGRRLWADCCRPGGVFPDG